MHPVERSLVVFLCPGQGSSWPGLLADTVDRAPVRRLLDALDGVVSAELGFTVRSVVTGERAFDFAGSQVLLYVASLATAAMVADEGVVPDLVLGHSVGEIPALVIAGAIDAETGMRVICRRTRAILEHGTPGGMLALQTDETRAHHLLLALAPLDVVVGAVNAPDQLVCSGAVPELERLAGVCAAAGIRATRLDVAFPAHHPCLSPVVAAFSHALGDLATGPSRVPVWSAIRLREWTTGTKLGPELSRQLVDPVRFADAVRQLYGRGARHFVECGGGRTLTNLVRRTLGVLPDVRTSVPLEAGPEGIAAAAAPSAGPMDTAAWARGRSVTEIANALGILAEALRTASEPAAPPAETPRAHTNGHAVAGATPIAVSNGHAVPPPAPFVAPVPISNGHAPAPAPAGAGDLERKVQALFADATEYPLDVLDLDADLEADLGIDSIKQAEILERVQREFALPPRSDLRLKEYSTLRKIAGLVASGLGA